MTTRTRLTALLLTFAVIVAACGGSSDTADDDSRSDGATTVPAGDADPGGTDAPETLDRLRIHHPETLAFAAPFALVGDDGPLSTIADDITAEAWTTPDVLRSIVINDQTDVVAVPTYVGANLFNKGTDVNLAAVVVWGLLWVIGPDGTPTDWESLRGETVMVPFQNDMPDLVFRHLAEANGLTPGDDFDIEYYATPPEAVMRLVSGKGRFAVLPEHVATVAINQAGENGNDLERLLDLQEEWGAATGSDPRIPQAGVILPGRLAQRPEVVGALLDELENQVATINDLDPDAIAKLSETFDLPEALISSLIPRLNLEIVPAGEARDELERFYGELAEFSPDIIGGKLPDAAFYLDDPR